MRALLKVLLCLLPGLAFAQISPAKYGVHRPHGLAAVNYLYGANGTFMEQATLYYEYNRYEHCTGALRPTLPLELESFAATHNHTAPDADCIILSDFNNDGELYDGSPAGGAFFEHRAKGINGAPSGNPYYQFWFDDNWLARYMAQAYGKPLPVGLHDNGYTLRWRKIGGDNWNGHYYSNSPLAIDQKALNGIYWANHGDIWNAYSFWEQILQASGSTYDSSDQRYEYPDVHETYHLALWGILSERLLAYPGAFWPRNTVLQHAMAIRSNLLSFQEKSQGASCYIPSCTRLGWRTHPFNSASLINTESTALPALALAANADYVFEARYPPLTYCTSCSYFLRPHNALSAVVGLSNVGFMIQGPGSNLPTGTYTVDYHLRTPDVVPGALVWLDALDGGTTLTYSIVDGSSMPGSNQWLRVTLPVTITSSSNAMQFRLYWYGSTNLDIGPIRVTRTGP